MRIKPRPLPVPDKDAKLQPTDFLDVLRAVPADCVLIGGQAVAWWSQRYGISPVIRGKAQAVTSRDIDFWGTRDDLLRIASRLKRPPALPNRYELTLLVGAIELEAAGKKTALEVLHAVPGLDSNNPLTVSVSETLGTGKGKLLVMSPVSLVLTKLHAVRHFSQEDRQDLMHLQVCLQTSKAFIAEVLAQDVRLALWNCNRLIDAQRQKPNSKLEQKHGFRILEAVPIDAIKDHAKKADVENRDRLSKFLRLQWPRVIAPGSPDL